MWKRVSKHPVITTSTAIGVVLIAGALFIQSRSMVPSEYDGTPWETTPGTFGSYTPIAAPQAKQPVQSTTVSSSTTILPYTLGIASTTPPKNTAPAISNDDLNALLDQLSQKHSTQPSTITHSTSTDHAYDWMYIPSTMIIAQSNTNKSADQKALFQYGNDIGSIIQGFASTHSDMVHTLTNAVNDRHDTSKEQAVERIGQGMIDTGNAILSETNVPTSAQTANTNLGNSYISAGKALIASAQAQGQLDAAYITSIQAYNTTSQNVIRAINAISLIFSINNVTFTQSDAGGMFMFHGASS